MVRIGRIVFDQYKVSSVVRENGSGHALKVTMHMSNGNVHEFNKYAKEAWEYFKGPSITGRTIAGA